MKNKEQIFSQLENEFLQARLHLANLKEMLKILKEKDMEEIILNIIMHSGEARSCSMEAIALAKKGDFKV